MKISKYTFRKIRNMTCVHFQLTWKVFEPSALNANAMRRTDSSVQSGPPWQRLIDFVEVGHFTGVFTHCALYIWLQTQMRWTQSILMSSARPTPESLVISSPLLLSFHLCPINESWLDLEKDKRDSCEQFNRAQWPPGVIWPFRNKSKTDTYCCKVSLGQRRWMVWVHLE